MKTQVLLALLGSSSAISLNDAPPYFNEPTWRQTWPSASGLVQLDEQVQVSACEQASQPGVICDPSFVQKSQNFAGSMNGDEDLDEDITMKGKPFHYAQKENNFANGMHGHEDLDQDITMKNIGYHYAQQGSDFANGMHGHEDLDQDITMKNVGYHYGQVNREDLVQQQYTDNMGYSAYNHPYFPGTTTPNFRIQQGGKCLTWDRDGNRGHDQHTLEFKDCENTNHQQWFNFHQMSRTIRAYSRNNFVITNEEGHHWVGDHYDAVLRPWKKDNYNIVDFSASAKCTIMNLDGPDGFALTNNNGNMQWQKCTGAANQKFSISPFEPGKGSYP